jgi:hypothetical protein
VLSSRVPLSSNSRRENCGEIFKNSCRQIARKCDNSRYVDVQKGLFAEKPMYCKHWAILLAAIVMTTCLAGNAVAQNANRQKPKPAPAQPRPSAPSHQPSRQPASPNVKGSTKAAVRPTNTVGQVNRSTKTAVRPTNNVKQVNRSTRTAAGPTKTVQQRLDYRAVPNYNLPSASTAKFTGVAQPAALSTLMQSLQGGTRIFGSSNINTPVTTPVIVPNRR